MTKGTGILLFFAGAVVGSVGTLFGLRADYKKKLSEEVASRDMAIRALKDDNRQKDYEISESNRKVSEKVSTEISKRLGYSQDDVSAMVRNAPTAHSVASQKKIEDLDVENMHPSEGNSDIPYGISVEDFLLGAKEYDKTTLTFYDGDQVLATENGDVVEDVNYILGPDWRNYIGKYEDNISYVRNENAGTDYEVIVEQKNYTDDWAV